MIAILTVTGLDHKGIIAAVAGRLSDLDVNIVNVSQAIMGDYFTMIMRCELDAASRSLEQVQRDLEQVGASQQVTVRLQSEAIFQAMHEV